MDEREFLHHLENARTRADEASWRVLINHWHTHLLRKASKYLHSPSEAEDAIGEFFLLIVQNQLLHKFRGKTILEFNSYLTTCLLNMLHNRRKSKEIAMSDEIDEIAIYAEPVLIFETKANLAAIQNALSELPLIYRTVIELQFFRERKQREIALMLKLPLNTISSHSRRARELLEKLLRKRGIDLIAL